MHSRPLIHNQLTGYLNLISTCFLKRLGKCAQGIVRAEYQQDPGEEECPRMLAKWGNLNCMASKPHLFSLPPSSMFSKLEQSQLFQEDSLVYNMGTKRGTDVAS